MDCDQRGVKKCENWLFSPQSESLNHQPQPIEQNHENQNQPQSRLLPSARRRRCLLTRQRSDRTFNHNP